MNHRHDRHYPPRQPVAETQPTGPAREYSCAAVPPPDCLPLRELDRATVRQVRQHERDWHAYDFHLGRSELRMPVAKRLIDLGCAMAPDELIITCGAQEALSLALRAVCRPGDCLTVESPIWYGALQVITALNLHVVEIPSHWRNGLDLPALRLALDQHPLRAVLCCAARIFPIPAAARSRRKPARN